MRIILLLLLTTKAKRMYKVSLTYLDPRLHLKSTVLNTERSWNTNNHSRASPELPQALINRSAATDRQTRNAYLTTGASCNSCQPSLIPQFILRIRGGRTKRRSQSVRRCFVSCAYCFEAVLNFKFRFGIRLQKWFLKNAVTVDGRTINNQEQNSDITAAGLPF